MGRKGDASTPAVMARRRGKDDNEGLTEQERLWKRLDLYSTPPWAARAGAEVALSLWPENCTVWEPACGYMNIAGPWEEHYPMVYGSDVYPHTPGAPVIDFLSETAMCPSGEQPDIIVSNPPFVTAEQFVRLALTRAKVGVAMLVRMVWLESVGRYDLFEGPEPLTLFCPFSERAAMVMGPWDPDAASATAYAWLFWSKQHDPMPPRWIPPGTRDRLWKREDAAMYGKRSPMPLFDAPTQDHVL